MVGRMGTAERRKTLRALKQRGIVVHVGALEELYSAFETAGERNFPGFLDKALELLSCPDGARDGILTKDLAASIGGRLKRDSDRREGVSGAGVEVIDSFTVPRWRPQAVATATLGSAGRRIQAPLSPIVDAPADAKGAMFRFRYELILSKTLRNPRFRPPTSSAVSMGKKSPYFQLTGVESLSGSKGEKFVLGMLTQLEEGSWFLEDLNGTVKLDLSEACVTAGLHTDCSFVIAQGFLVEDEGEEPIFQVSAMGTPPFESREDSIAALGRDANLFGGQFDPTESPELVRLEAEAEDTVFMLMSDVALDSSRVMAGLRHVFRGYLEDEFVPAVVVLMGNFLSHPFGQQVDDVSTLSEKFGELGEMISTEFKPLADESTFVIIPGASDPGPGNVLPRPPMPKMITRRFVEALGSERVHLATNPCRIRYMTQEITLMRDDIMQKMVRHCSIKPDFSESGLISEHLVKSLVDQAYLCPLPSAARPVLWSHDHSLWLFPTPHVIVVADKVDSYICEYGRGLGLNPGSFATDFSFQMYLPAQKRAQQCSVDSEHVGGRAEKLDNKTNDDEDIASINPPMAGQPTDYENDDEMQETESHGNAELSLEETEQAHESVVNNSVHHHSVEAEAESLQLEGSRTDRNSGMGSHSEEEVGEDESDDDSVLVPAEGLKRLDIKTLVRNSTAIEESYIPEGSEGEGEE